jgi:glycosyltransferase involved in cell wall biosynthesis
MAAPLTIAHVLPSFGLGGQERVALGLAEEQRAQGHDLLVVSLAALPDGPMAAEFRRVDVEPVTIPKSGKGLDWSLPGRLAKEFLRRKVDVVHAHNPQSLIYAALAGKAAGTGVVYTSHGQNSLAPGRLWLTRLASLFVDAYVGVSPRIACRALRHRECPEGKVRTIENGVNLAAFHPDPQARREVRAELGVPEEAWVVGTVGRLVDDKNPGLLLRASLPLLGPQTRLLFVGDGPLTPGLRAEAAAHPAGGFVSLLGARQDVPRLLAAMDVFALSSRTEGMPLALLEAMSVGLPIVSTAVGGVPDVVRDGICAKLVPSEDDVALRAALAWLRDDRGEAARLGANARAESARFAAATMVKRYGELYRECQRPLTLV